MLNRTCCRLTPYPAAEGRPLIVYAGGKCAPITRLKLNRYLACSEFISPVYWPQQIGLQTCLKLIPASYMMHHQASAMACRCKQPSLNAVAVAKPLPAASSWMGLQGKQHLSGETHERDRLVVHLPFN